MTQQSACCCCFFFFFLRTPSLLSAHLVVFFTPGCGTVCACFPEYSDTGGCGRPTTTTATTTRVAMDPVGFDHRHASQNWRNQKQVDIIHRYNADEARNLKQYGELPEHARINETAVDLAMEGDGAEDDIGIDFDDI